jgi:hypothetical protein
MTVQIIFFILRLENISPLAPTVGSQRFSNPIGDAFLDSTEESFLGFVVPDTSREYSSEEYEEYRRIVKIEEPLESPKISIIKVLLDKSLTNLNEDAFSDYTYESFTGFTVPDTIQENKDKAEELETIGKLEKTLESIKLSIIKFLLDLNGTDAGIVDKESRSPMSQAAALGNLDAIKMFIESGKTDFNRTEMLATSPLHEAAKQGHISVVEYLVESGVANITSQDKNGRTALHEACARSQTGMVK